jgi:hypothetical protein
MKNNYLKKAVIMILVSIVLSSVVFVGIFYSNELRHPIQSSQAQTSPQVTFSPTPSPTPIPSLTPTSAPTSTPASKSTPLPTSTPTQSPIQTPDPTLPPTSPTPISTPTPTPTPTLTTGKFGNTQVGLFLTTLLPGFKDSCRYQAPHTGNITSISMFILTANAKVRFGVYSDSNGLPNQLIAQSSEVNSVANEWITANLTTPIAADQYYWLTVISDIEISYYYDYGNTATSGYASEASNTLSAYYGAFTEWENARFSMYATYATTDSVAHSPTPSATPSSTHSPSSPNLVPIPNAWGSYEKLGDVYFGKPSNPQLGHVDYSVRHNGDVSIRIDGPAIPENQFREINTDPISVNPGDHIVFTCWIKTAPSTIGDGGIIGFDVYGNYDRIWEVTNYATGNDNDCFDVINAWNYKWVPYGSDWTQIVIDVIIPDKTFTTNNFGSPLPNGAQQISFIIPWIGASWKHNEAASVWFADAELFINP